MFKVLNAAMFFYRSGDISAVDLICSELLENGWHDSIIYCLRALTALEIGEFKRAEEYYLKSLSNSSCLPDTLLELQKDYFKTKYPENSSFCYDNTDKQTHLKRFILIKAWGFGFWSDVDHLLGQLLFAEMTDRIPVVHWGQNSLYTTSTCDNAFELYFNPISKYSIYDLINKDFTFFPPKWNNNNLLKDNLNKHSGPFSSMSGLYFLNKPQQVVVSDFHTALNDLIPWIKKDHHLFGLKKESIYKYLIKKYLRLRPELIKEIDDYFFCNMMHKMPVMALHVRGGHKCAEDSQISSIYDMYQDKVDEYIAKYKNAALFLLTNDDRIVNYYKNRYKDKIILTDCIRTATDTDAHYYKHFDHYNLGKEVILDTFLAAKCDHFIGYGWSNLSCLVSYFKNWPKGSCTLLGDSMHSARLIYSPKQYQLVPTRLFLKSL